MSVYSITHRETGREYIGITAGRPQARWRVHAKRDSHIGRALRAHGTGAFDFRVEMLASTWLEACALECALIAERKPQFNQTLGGDGRFGHSPSDATRAKMRASQKGLSLGRKASPETRAKLSAAARGRKLSPESIAKTAAANTGKPKSPETRAKIADKARGRKHTDQTRAKLRDARRAQGTPPSPKFTEAHRLKMRQAQLGKKQSAETKAKRSASLKLAYAEGRKLRQRIISRDACGRISGKVEVK